MGVRSPGERGAFEIVSARTGSREPLVYEGSGKVGKNKETGREEKCPGGGSASAARAAISEDGREVAFTVLGKSNLTAEQSNPDATVTPPDQVAVRELGATPEASIPAGATPETPTTTLVSVTRGEQPVPGGAALSGRPEIQQQPLRHGEGTTELSNVDASTAAISADGNAVAWMGVNIFDQAPTNGGRIETIEKEIEGGQKYVDDYAEPLWREISPKRETRRPLAGDDASAPDCPPSCAGGLDLEWDEQATAESQELVGPQYGSDVAGWKTGFLKVETVTPQLSKDGQEVAIISTQPNYGHLPEFGSFEADREKQPDANAFVVNMASGLSRAQAITRLTEWGSIDFENRALDGAIDQIAISSDGTRVAFTTERSVFALAPPALITAPVSQEEPAQLYEANLKAGTLALVSEGYNGEPANLERGESGANEPALSADGGVVALTSGSSNLAFGTINQGSAVFVTREDDSPDEPGRQSVTALPPGPAGEQEWSISATAVSTSGGALLIDVSVPGAGRLAASASAPVPTTRDGGKSLRQALHRPRREAKVVDRDPPGGPRRDDDRRGRPRATAPAPIQPLPAARRREGRALRDDRGDVRGRRPSQADGEAASRLPAPRPPPDRKALFAPDEAQAAGAEGTAMKPAARSIGALLAALAVVAIGPAPAGAASWQFAPASTPAPPPGVAPVSRAVPVGRIGAISFWSPNRGLLIDEGTAGCATTDTSATVPCGLYAYNGEGWHLLSNVCGSGEGSIAWAGPDEFWTISDQRPGQSTGAVAVERQKVSLCHFLDGRVVASYATQFLREGTELRLPNSYRPMNAAACLSPTTAGSAANSGSHRTRARSTCTGTARASPPSIRPRATRSPRWRWPTRARCSRAFDLKARRRIRLRRPAAPHGPLHQIDPPGSNTDFHNVFMADGGCVLETCPPLPNYEAVLPDSLQGLILGSDYTPSGPGQSRTPAVGPRGGRGKSGRTPLDRAALQPGRMDAVPRPRQEARGTGGRSESKPRRQGRRLDQSGSPPNPGRRPRGWRSNRTTEKPTSIAWKPPASARAPTGSARSPGAKRSAKSSAKRRDPGSSAAPDRSRAPPSTTAGWPPSRVGCYHLTEDPGHPERTEGYPVDTDPELRQRHHLPSRRRRRAAGPAHRTAAG